VASALQFARQVFPASDVLDAYVARCAERPAAVKSMQLDGAAGV